MELSNENMTLREITDLYQLKLEQRWMLYISAVQNIKEELFKKLKLFQVTSCKFLTIKLEIN